MKLLSVIVPCYNEEENVRDFYDELCKNTEYFEKSRSLWKSFMWMTAPKIRQFQR